MATPRNTIFIKASEAAVYMGYNKYQSVAPIVYKTLCDLFPESVMRIKNSMREITVPKEDIAKIIRSEKNATDDMSDAVLADIAGVSMDAVTRDRKKIAQDVNKKIVTDLTAEITDNIKKGNVKEVATMTGISEDVLTKVIAHDDIATTATTLQKKQEIFKEVVSQEASPISKETRDALIEAAVSTSNCSYGTRSEKAVFDSCKKVAPNLRTVTGIKYSRDIIPPYTDTHDGSVINFTIMGIPDGINESEKYILEIKNRQKKLFYKGGTQILTDIDRHTAYPIPIRDYEYVQVHLYMMQTGIHKAKLTENYNGKRVQHTHTVDFDYDEIFVGEMIRRLHGFAKTVRIVAANEDMLRKVITQKNVGKDDPLNLELLKLIVD